jgi:hypothetical protein
LSIIAQCTSYRERIAAHKGCFRISAPFDSALKWSDVSHTLLEFFLGVTVSFKHWRSSFSQVVKVTQLMRRIRKHASNRVPYRALTIRNHCCDWHIQGIAHLFKQTNQIVLGRGEEGAHQQDLTRKSVANDPEYFITNIWLETINRQDYTAGWSS